MTQILIHSKFGTQEAKPFEVCTASAKAVAEYKKINSPEPELTESEASRESDGTSPEAKN